ncbi:hypothetical protein SLAV_08465 [Streptomyces lavendulae subsp. lavendulae]|uniref:Uncharacterized protein n=1 Tax=Streptomyces lavendulae subsp. lavendulae TaxID=58340 RepID=A0A2K8P9Z0_STRLA|nr:hypothetical protein SLAV_08465 [Streptomyces lavendulae subsp. lavendulae]QUQ53395.1 hypothetical protein SLLC_06495 [Streptomyces lavendulae subsp. lavendulae]
MDRKRIARVVRERGIRGITRRGRRSLTRADTKARPAPDLIGRGFHIVCDAVGSSAASPVIRASPSGRL